MSVVPETDSNIYVDWCRVATNFVRVSPKPSKSNCPLRFLWPPNVWSLLVCDDKHVSTLIAHGRSCGAKGTVVVLNPTKSSRRLMESLSFVSLAFQPGDPVFDTVACPQSVFVYFCKSFELQASASLSAAQLIQVSIHPLWDKLVTLPVNTVNVGYMRHRLALHPIDEEVFLCLDGLQYGVSYELSNALDRLRPHLSRPKANFNWELMKPLMDSDENKCYTSKVFPWKSSDSSLHLPLFNIMSQGTFVNFKKITGKPRKINDLKNLANLCQIYLHVREWLGFKAAKKLLQYFGPGTLMRKDDVVAAYKVPPLKPQDWRAAGESLPPPGPTGSRDIAGIVLNLRTIFGATNSFKMFDRALGAPLHFCLNLAVREALQHAELDPVLNSGMIRWSDDYITLLCGDENFAPRWDLAKTVSHAIAAEAKNLNVEMTCSDFDTEKIILGHGLRSETMESFLTDARRQHLLFMVEHWIACYEKCTAKRLDEWQSLGGSLRFGSDVVECGNTFCNPIDAVIGTMTKKNLKSSFVGIHVARSLKWWKKTLSNPEACTRSLLIDYEWKHASELGLTVEGITTDASFKGRAFVFKEEYFTAAWDSKILEIARRKKTFDINFLEAYNVVDAAASCGQRFTGKSVIMKTDSKVWEQVWKNGKAKCPFLAELLTCLVDICLHYNFRLRIEHIAGVNNVESDLLSRNCLQEFLRLKPNAKPMISLEWPTKPIWPVQNF